jgi:hypothetical protein
MFDSLSGREVPVRADEGGLLPGKKRSRWRIFVLSVALAVIMCSAAPPAAHASVGPRQIDAFLLAQGSPLAGEGRVFYDVGRQDGVDPAFLVAISGAESSFGQYLFSAGSQTAANNAFNWFYASTRAGSSFVSWDQAIAAVAEGLRGPLYYGAGRYAVGAIGPIYCPQGTQAWIDNVTTYMLELGGDPSDTRWRGAASVGTSQPQGDGLGIGPAGVAAALVVQRPITLTPATAVARARLRIRFTLTNEGLKAGSWKAVILRLQGPSGQALAYGSNVPLRLKAGASYSFEATARLLDGGVWRGWVDVEAQDGTILAAARPALRIAVARASSARRPAVVGAQRRRQRGAAS